MSQGDLYQQPLSAFIGTIEKKESLELALEVALQSEKRRSSWKPEHARKYFFMKFAKHLAQQQCFVSASPELREIVGKLVACAKDQQAIKALAG